MAAGSILTSVTIKGGKPAKAFIRALEKAEKRKGKPVVLSREMREVGAEEIDEFLSALKK